MAVLLVVVRGHVPTTRASARTPARERRSVQTHAPRTEIVSAAAAQRNAQTRIARARVRLRSVYKIYYDDDDDTRQRRLEREEKKTVPTACNSHPVVRRRRRRRLRRRAKPQPIN